MTARKYPDHLSRLQALCSGSEKCAFDIRQNLRRHLVPADEVERIVERLERDGYIDAARYAAAFVHDKTLFAHWGPRKIEAALRAKQFDTATIRTALADIAPTPIEPLLQAKARTLKCTDPRDCRARLLRFAIARGFDYNTAMQAVEQLAIDN